ncbi:MAG: FAD-binding oxidoreductase [Chloroflexi bacterium]|nr:FAD-binding oxidoreductase [Chloroflexota bacterium]
MSEPEAETASRPARTQDFLVDGRTPARVERPQNQDELAALLREANSAGEAVILHGGHTGIEIGNPPSRYDLALDLTALDQIVDLEPEDFTVTVQAGISMSTLEQTLAQHGQFVPLDAPLAERATVGGLVAKGRGGARRARFGTVRDWLIGCSMLLPDGTPIKGGGRVVKNVSGFDLPKLFAGSFGTLGCITQATFKVRPLPVADVTLLAPCDSFDAALELGRAMGRDVHGLEAAVALDAETAAQLNLDIGPALLLRIAGIGEAIDAMREILAGRTPSGTTQQDTDPALWHAVDDLEAPVLQSGVRADDVLLRFGALPSHAPAIVAAIDTALAGVTTQAIQTKPRRWAYADTGLVFAALPVGDPSQTAATIAELRGVVEARQGALTVERASPALKDQIDVWGDPGEGVTIMRALKTQFDPKATLSPGRFVGGI